MVEGLGRVPESRREADQAATVLLRRTGSPVAHVEEVRSQVVLERLRELAGLHPELAVGPLRALAEQDVSKGTAWVASLRAYLDCFGDMAAAAAHVNVHPNTFRYRIRRITEVFGLDLTDPDERLVAELQLRLLDDAS
jgi:sugar diacid utilization regulator